MKAKSFILMLAAAVLLASCTTPARIGYLRDMEYNTPYITSKPPELKLKTYDNLTIHVYSTVDELLAVPFNTGAEETYTIDVDGNINFPVIGKIYVEGLTINQLKEEISYRINSSGYMKDPLVNVTLNNFTVTVLGETGQGVVSITDHSMNILQLIAQSGGTSAASKIRDIMVIRTENDRRMAYSVNLQTKDIFDSPVFYLQQNDIIYVKPVGIRMSETGNTILNAIQRVNSLVTLFFFGRWASLIRN